MSRLAPWICICACLLFFKESNGQIPFPQNSASTLRQKSFKIESDSLKIDTLSIVPGSFKLVSVPDSLFTLDMVNALLIWKKKPLLETVFAVYRVFPFRLNPAAQRMRYDSIVNNFFAKPIPFNGGSSNNPRGIFDFGTLKAEGSLGRQIGFGNRQDAVVQSTLNLQLSGMLADSIEVQAAITDNNIPIQPDGTTQQLNEFDQIFLQFRKKNWQVSLGDIDIRQTQDYFLNFYKRLQGLSVQSENRISKTINSKTLFSGSVAKGKFTRNILEALEGNQGPYRLRGAANEIFFIVLANTERVFLDGQMLQRGEDQDYIINYNSAEITFTPKRMITKDSRIQVEFEYADRNFLNANLFLLQEFSFNKKGTLRIGVFNNSDAKNSPINQVLDNRQKQFLANLGDSIHKAFFPAATLDSFDVNKILYKKVYSGLDSFYVYSTDPATAKYNLSFIDVKPGNGNYVPDFNGANGKVYKYVAPVGGIRQGSFEPVQVLITPKVQQIINMGVDYKFNEQTTLKTEIATSNMDLNSFSSRNNGDDRGWAGKFRLANSQKLGKGKKTELLASLDYEYVQAKFKPLERLRNVEFSRDWGLAFNNLPVTENILKAGTRMLSGNGHSLEYQFTHYKRSDQYQGAQHAWLQALNWKGWVLNNQFVVTGFHTDRDKGSFLRPVIDISKQLKSLNNYRLGFKYALERNVAKNTLSDTLTPLAFSFESYSVYIKSDEARKNKYGISFFTRSDKYPFRKELVLGDRSLNLNVQAELLANPNRQFYLNSTFRKLAVHNSSLSRQKEDETILGRAEYVMSEWKGLLTGNILYEVGAGQEQRRDFAYLEVPAGTGQYAWIDYNNDGAQQLNEFEIAAFTDQAKFIRVLTPTNEFIKANFIVFNYSITLNPRAILNKTEPSGMQKFLSKINLGSSFQTHKKSIALGNFEFNPFKYGVTDTALITLNTTVLNSFSFNRYHSKWGVDLSNLRNNAKALLTYGYESRKLNEWLFKARWNVSTVLNVSLYFKKGVNALRTPKFANRNYELSLYSIEPSFTFIKGTSFQIVSGYKWSDKKNLILFGGEHSSGNELFVETRYNVLQSGSLTGKFTLNSIRYNAAANTAVSYIMLDGLLPGKNFLWTLGFKKRLMNNLELNFTYDGRKAGTSRTVHIGRAAITALF